MSATVAIYCPSRPGELPKSKSTQPRSARRVTLVVAYLGLVNFDSDVPPFCPTAQPILTNFHLSKQNRTDSGIAKIKVNPTQVRDHQSHPVFSPKFKILAATSRLHKSRSRCSRPKGTASSPSTTSGSGGPTSTSTGRPTPWSSTSNR